MLALQAFAQGIGELTTICHAVQLLKRTVFAGITRDLDSADLHTGKGALARLLGVVFKGKLTSGEEQQAPLLALAQLPILAVNSSRILTHLCLITAGEY